MAIVQCPQANGARPQFRRAGGLNQVVVRKTNDGRPVGLEPQTSTVSNLETVRDDATLKKSE
jgi:hypothetical protein